MNSKSGQDFFLFLIGGALFAAGIFLFTSQVMVGSGSGFGLPWGRGFRSGYPFRGRDGLWRTLSLLNP